MDDRRTPTYKFEGFRLDSTLQVLVNPAGEAVPLNSRAFATLHYLVERAGQIVGKSELMSAVWPQSVVAENNLNQCILQLRKVLGESAGDRRFILTVPGRGFKFVARVIDAPYEPLVPALHSTGTGTGIEKSEPIENTAGAAAPALVAARSAPRSRVPWPRSWPMVGVVAAAGLALWLTTSLRKTAPHAVTAPAEYQPLTDVADSATAPILSPDGRMLAFIRNGYWLLGSGQIWLKLLPDGDYVKLTNASGLLFSPAFSPDGTKIAYTVVDKRGESWDTWVVPITGGEPTKLLPNATGLTWIGQHEVMFSEFKSGIHLGVVTTDENRANKRDVYTPAHERAMAHFSYLSPDRRSVLLVEMDGTGNFRQCRVVPFDGGSSGTPVGPANGACLAAAWSPDGNWMYFTVAIAGHSHLWRQHFPDGAPEQITFGPANEQTVFASADGKSLLTAIGSAQTTLWLHDASGERAITTEGDSSSPWLSTDARRVYFLSENNSAAEVALSRIDLTKNKREVLLPEFNVAEFDVDPDEQQVVFSQLQDGASQIWIAPLDRHAPPRLIAGNADQPQFGGGDVYFRSLGKQANHLHRIHPDGSDDTEVSPSPIVNFDAVAPDGRTAMVDRPVEDGLAAAWLISTAQRGEQRIGKGWFPSHWSRDGKQLYVEIGNADDATTPGRTAVLNLKAGGLPTVPILPLAAGTTVIAHAESNLSVGQNPSVYIYVKYETQRNIYRIPLH